MSETRSQRVLVVEDDAAQRRVIRYWLSATRDLKLETVEAASRTEALSVLKGAPPDAVLLDLTLADGNGLHLLDMMRRHLALREIPILIISGARADDDVAGGLNRGADDYLVKPLVEKVFRARLLAALRRRRENVDAATGFVLGPGFRVHPQDGRLLIGNRIEHLEPKETALLLLFLRRPNVIHAPEALYEHVWGRSRPAHNSLESRLHTLRRKLGADGLRLENVHGRGYRFVV